MIHAFGINRMQFSEWGIWLNQGDYGDVVIWLGHIFISWKWGRA